MNLRMGLILAGSLVIVGGCAASSGPGTSAPAIPSSGGTTLAQGERPRENDMTRSAEENLEQAAQAGSLAEAMQHYQLAAESAQQAIDADPTNPLPYRQLAAAQIGLGDFTAADAAMDEAERLRPIYQIETEGEREQAWLAKYNEAIPLVNASDYEGAIAAFEQADAIYGARPEVKFYLGQLYVQAGRYDEAVPVLREAQAIVDDEENLVGMDSTTVASWHDIDAQIPEYIVAALIQSNQYGAAAQELEKLLVTDPDNVDLLRQLAQLQVEMGEAAEARATYERMAATGALSATDLYALGVGYYRMDDYDGAAASFKAAAEASPKDRDALEMWTRSIQIAYPQGDSSAVPPPGKLEEMAGAAERWVELDPNNQTAMLILAQTANRLGDEDQARALVEAIEALPVTVGDFQLQRYPNGGGMVTGSVTNVSMEPNSTVTINFQFYDERGSQIGTEQARVVLPVAEASQTFQVEFDSEQQIAGYGYTIDTGM